VDRKDVRVIESGGELDFSQETLGAERMSQLGVKDFERDQPVVLEVPCEIHGGHAAAPEFTLGAIAIGKAAFELLGQFCQFRA